MTRTLPARPISPTVVTNTHGARFLLIGYDEVNGDETACLVDTAGCKVWIPVASFRNHFKVEAST